MVKLSEETIRLLKEDILGILNESKRNLFTKEIAKELRRDKEFTLKLLLDMKEMGWVREKSGKGVGNVRKRWVLSQGLLKAWNK
jgi:DNA-binding IclR family transcriptional regulator